MIFKTIGTGDDTQVVNLLKARKIAQDEVNKSLQEQAAQLEIDRIALSSLEQKVSSGIPYEEAYAQTMTKASVAAKEQAVSTKGAAGMTDTFVSKQRSAQASLKATATASKTASIAMRALSMAANMFVIGLITKGIELAGTAISDYIHRVEKANEKIEESRSNYDDATSSIESMNEELKTTQDKINDLQSKSTLSFTDKAELDNLNEQNNELERNIALQEKKKQNAASQAVNDIKQNQETLSDDFDESIKNLSEYKKEYEDTKQVGINGMHNGTVTLENYEATMTAMDKNMDLYENHVLDNIEKFEKYKEDIIHKYGTDDISKFSTSDSDLYTDIVNQLQKAYKIIYSNSEYNKFVIEPIFDTDKLKDLQNKLLQYFTNGGDTDLSSLEKVFGTDIITALQNACEKAGIDFDEMIQDMYDNSQSKLNQIAPIIKTPNGEADAKQNQISQQIRDYIQNGLSEKDRTILLNAEIPDDVKFNTIQDVNNFIRSLQTEVDTTPLSFKEAWKALADDTKTSLLELAESGELTDKTFSKVSGADEFAESLKKLGLTTDDVIQKINKMQNSADQLSSMKSGISSISSVLGEKKDNLSHKKTKNVGIGADTLAGLPDEVKSSKKEYEEFCNILGDGNSSMEECRKAANLLATAYVNNNNFLSKLTQSNKDYYKSVLDEMGVENSAQIIEAKLSEKTAYLAAKKKYATETGKKLVEQTSEEIQRFAEEQGYTDGTTNTLLQLALKKELVNNTTLSFENDIATIKDYVKALGVATSALTTMQRIKQGKGVDGKAASTVGMPEEARKFVQDQGQKEVDKALKKNKTELKVDVNPSPVTSGSGSKNSGSKKKKKDKDSKEEINWIERKLTVLQAKIDTTAGKLQNLFSIKAKKNNINKQLTETQNLLNANRKAAKAYQKEANKVNLSGKLKAKVRSGDYDITKYDSKTADKINKYQDYIDKAREARDAVQDNIASIHELNQQKLDNITDWFDKLIGKINATISKLNTKADLTSKIRGFLGQAETGTKTEYKSILSNQANVLKENQNELKDYEAERQSQRKKLVNKQDSKTQSNRQATKQFLKRSGWSDADIKKELKKFDKANKKSNSAELKDFDATTKTEAETLRENVLSTLSDMLDTAQSLANIPIEKLQKTLDNLSTDFTKLENRANRAATQLENVGIGLDYFKGLSSSQISNKYQAYKKSKSTYDDAVAQRNSLAALVQQHGINPSSIKTATDLQNAATALGAKSDYEGINYITQYLAQMDAVNSAWEQLNSASEDYYSTVENVVSSLYDAQDKLLENQIEKDKTIDDRAAKRRAYTDDSTQDRIGTINTNAYNSNYAWAYKDDANKYLSDAQSIAQFFQGIHGMYTGDVADKWLQIEKTLANTFSMNADNIDATIATIPQDIIDWVSDNYPDYLDKLLQSNEALIRGEKSSENAKNEQATYNYETIPQTFKDIFSVITNEADRAVSTVQRDIDAIDNALEDGLFSNQPESYIAEASLYKNQQSIYNSEVADLEKRLATFEASGLGKNTDVWNELVDQINAAKDNATKAGQSYTTAIVNAFNALGDIADRNITEIGKNMSKLESQMSMYEAQGHFITSDFYTQQGGYYAEQQAASQKKATDLQAELDSLVDSGDIKEYSARWYEMKDKIDDATQSALDYGVKVKESTKSTFDAVLQLGEKSREAITRMNDEADFYQDILGRDKLVDEKTGAFTSNGLASMSLSYEKMTNDIVNKNNIQKEIDKVKERYANGTNDDYGIEQYNEDMDNLLSQQREAIQNYYDERDAVMSLVEDGLNKQLEVLQDIVDKYKEAMDKASDLRDYQNSVDDATKNIASLQKQLEVVRGNDSEEGRATAQSLQKQLEDAQKDLDDLEWDKKKSDMEDILDQMMDDAQDFIDDKLDQITDSIDQIRDLLPENAKEVYDTLKNIDAQWGTQISDNLAEGVKLGDYSTITKSIDSAAAKIAQAAYDAEKAKLEEKSGTENPKTDNPPSLTPDTGNTSDTPSTETPSDNRSSTQKAKDFVLKYGSYGAKQSSGRSATELNKTTEMIAGVGVRIADSKLLDALHELGEYRLDNGVPDEFKRYRLNELLLGGFSHGGVVGQINKQVRANNDDALISVKSGEGILTPQQTEMFQKLIQNMPSLVDLAEVKMPNIPLFNNTSKNVTVEMGDMHFDLPNVTDTDSFINAWKTDTKLKNFMSDVVSGTVTGDNSKAMRY